MTPTISIKEYPTHYYNIVPDLPGTLDLPLHPGTKQPVGPKDFESIFPPSLIHQEMSQEREIEIPEEVRELYLTYRPTPLMRARRLEKVLDTPAHIYFKYEGATLSGSHKLNTAIAQAYYNKKDGTKKLTTETGAGQWGSALSIACKMFGLDCEVYMVRASYEQKPYRKYLMRLYDASVYSSPSNQTSFGKKILVENPENTGSLGIAISEAIEQAVKDKSTKYALGSVLNHVLLHQTIIGLEAKKQMETEGEYPDTLIGCVGGGSNFGGLAFPFLRDTLSQKQKGTRFIAVEPVACPTLTKGEYRYDFGDTAHMTPLMKMYTLGSDFMPDPIRAGGLRYHGMAPTISLLHERKYIEAVAVSQENTFKAGILFAQQEGIVPAPESAHAIKVAIDEALKAKEEGKKKVILFNLSGNGYFDMQAYADFMEGKLSTI